MEATWKNHYWHNRGATPWQVVQACKEMGGKPCRWSDLSRAFEVVKARLILGK